MGNYHEEEAYLGLVLYNANSEVGFDIQILDWTRDVNRFLEILSCLTFNGNDVNQYVMAEGLADALMMFPRPSKTNAMTKQEYFNGERHCILVATGDPIPKRMQVSVPIIQDAPVVSPIFQACNVDFLEVAQMFASGNDTPLATTPTSHCEIGQFHVLLSRNFQGAHDALQENKTMDLPVKRNVESINPTADQSFPACEVAIRNLNIEAPKDVGLETIGSQIHSLEPHVVLPNATNQMHGASSNSQYPMNMYDDIMAELIADKDISTSEKHMTLTTLEDDYFHSDLLPFDDINDTLVQDQQISSNKNISMEGHKVDENTLEQAVREATQHISENQTSNNELTANSSKEVNIPPQVVPKEPTSTTGKGCSTGLLQELRSKRGVMNPIHNSGNSSNVALSVPYYPLSLGQAGPQTWYHPHGMSMMNTSTTSGMVNPQGPNEFSTGASFDNAIYPFAKGNSLMQIQSNSFPSQLPLFPYASMGASNWLPPMSGMASMSYQGQNLPPPSLSDFHNYVNTWEGSLSGKFHSNRVSVIKAQAFRRPTTPSTLIFGWADRLEIRHFIPEKVVSNTQGPMDYVFFRIPQSNNTVDLHDYLSHKKLCAKIDVPFQAIILSPTENKYMFIGMIFSGFRRSAPNPFFSNHNPLAIVISGPIGGSKDTNISRLSESCNGLHCVVTVTSRPDETSKQVEFGHKKMPSHCKVPVLVPILPSSPKDQVRKLYCVSRVVPNLPINLEDATRSEVEIEKALQVH
ncbi:Mediator complex, subunit Med25, von Willebrand factor type A [Sesbania bispinosa]|nr:Mediator complex, subunit Med25, von Willebrand factor type A [Sesbania bispinosa]